jgi:hypothetical protein
MSDQDRSLIEITLDLGINHEVNKTAKKDLDTSRGEFFEAATKALEEGILAQRSVGIPRTLGGQRDLVETWAAKWYPGWRVVSVDDDEKVQLEEDPSLKKFVYVNKEDGRVYQRNAIQGNPSLDDDALKADDPELWERISRPVPYPDTERLQEFCDFADVPYDTMMSWVETKQSGDDWARVLIDPEEMSDADMAAMQPYLVPAPVTLRLEAPRDAKPEELEDDD